ncbi:protein amnionless [Carcharodon carcharias]|uniref:protein amnionless n=1 Tax=Carcharodon carcharias TaxID=13397 RepID=UPI001B7DC396|nr:protein amnionless [Carcharodon carcharias]
MAASKKKSMEQPDVFYQGAAPGGRPASPYQLGKWLQRRSIRQAPARNQQAQTDQQSDFKPQPPRHVREEASEEEPSLHSPEPSTGTEIHTPVEVSDALYRQWIPDTNFNNVTNWDKGRIPCKTERVQFPRDKSLSVFVQPLLNLMEMSIPLDGEFILSHGSGFAASDGQNESGCERGEVITFKDPNQYKWYDPKYWHTALSMSDLENEKYLFTLDEEGIPCQYDDVIFQPGTSFRVDLDSDIQIIKVKTISIMDRKFASNEEFTEYKWSNTGKLQFHGNGSITVTNAKCEDKSGCECGNFGNHRRICSNLQQGSGSHCPGLGCTNPLKPKGHCCKICGAIIYLEYGPGFDLESYRAQLIHSFLGLKKYKGVQMSVTKIYRKQSSKKIIPIDAVPRIQIVLIDKVKSAPGTLAATLAQEIMKIITSQEMTHKYQEEITLNSRVGKSKQELGKLNQMYSQTKQQEEAKSYKKMTEKLKNENEEELKGKAIDVYKLRVEVKQIKSLPKTELANGDKFGITNAELKKSTNSEEQEGRNMGAGKIVGIVAGVFIAALLIGNLIYLIISGKIR